MRAAPSKGQGLTVKAYLGVGWCRATGLGPPPLHHRSRWRKPGQQKPQRKRLIPNGHESGWTPSNQGGSPARPGDLSPPGMGRDRSPLMERSRTWNQRRKRLCARSRASVRPVSRTSVWVRSSRTFPLMRSQASLVLGFMWGVPDDVPADGGRIHQYGIGDVLLWVAGDTGHPGRCLGCSSRTCPSTASRGDGVHRPPAGVSPWLAKTGTAGASRSYGGSSWPPTAQPAGYVAAQSNQATCGTPTMWFQDQRAATPGTWVTVGQRIDSAIFGAV